MHANFLAAFVSVLAVVNAQSKSTSIQSPTTAAASATSVAAADGFTDVGCYSDPQKQGDGRTVVNNTLQMFADNMTVTNCLSFCKGKKYAALEFGRECFCGDSLNNKTSSSSNSSCNLACNGDSNQVCGGSWEASLYQSSDSLQKASSGASSYSLSQPILFGSFAAVALMIGAAL